MNHMLHVLEVVLLPRKITFAVGSAFVLQKRPTRSFRVEGSNLVFDGLVRLMGF
jgi:hypothetical protein